MYLRSILADLFFSNKIKSQKEIEISKPAIDKYAKSIFNGTIEVFYFFLSLVFWLPLAILLFYHYFTNIFTGFLGLWFFGFKFLIAPLFAFASPIFLVLSVRKYRQISSTKKILLLVKCIFYFSPFILFSPYFY